MFVRQRVGISKFPQSSKIALVVEWLSHIPDKNEKKVQFLPRVQKPNYRFIYGGYSITVSMLDCGSEGESSILSSHPKKKLL